MEHIKLNLKQTIIYWWFCILLFVAHWNDDSSIHAVSSNDDTACLSRSRIELFLNSLSNGNVSREWIKKLYLVEMKHFFILKVHFYGLSYAYKNREKSTCHGNLAPRWILKPSLVSRLHFKSYEWMIRNFVKAIIAHPSCIIIVQEYEAWDNGGRSVQEKAMSPLSQAKCSYRVLRILYTGTDDSVSIVKLAR